MQLAMLLIGNDTCNEKMKKALTEAKKLPFYDTKYISWTGEETIPLLSLIGKVVYTVNATDEEDDRLFFNLTCTTTPCPFSILQCKF